MPIDSFHPDAARAVVEGAAVSDCPLRGIAPGTARAVVTFTPDGIAKQVKVAAPPDLSPEAVACMTHKIGTVRVVPFAGGDRTVEASWRVP